MKNREQQYKLYIEEQHNLLMNLKDYAFDLINKLREHKVPIYEEIQKVYYVMDNEFLLNERYKGYFNTYDEVVRFCLKEDISIHINDDNFVFNYPLDYDKTNIIDEDVDGVKTLSITVTHKEFFENDLDTFINSIKTKINLIIDTASYFKATANIRNLKLNIDGAKNYSRIKIIDSDGTIKDIANEFTFDENNNLILHLYNK